MVRARRFGRAGGLSPAARRLLGDDDAGRLVDFWKAARLAPTRLAYPDTSLDLADVRARLVLASILEGSLERARSSWKRFAICTRMRSERLAGRKEPYAVGAGGLMGEARLAAASGDRRLADVRRQLGAQQDRAPHGRRGGRALAGDRAGRTARGRRRELAEVQFASLAERSDGF